MAAYTRYVERLAELDLQSRKHEISNLSGFEGKPQGNQALQRTRDCGRLLRELDVARPRARVALLEGARVPDDYSTVARILGLYPVTQLVFAAGIGRWEQEAQAAFQEHANARTAVVRYAPPSGEPMPRRIVARLIARASADPLGQVRLSERELAELAPVYAPSFEIALAGDYDRFGALQWQRGERTPQVDAMARPCSCNSSTRSGFPNVRAAVRWIFLRQARRPGVARHHRPRRRAAYL